VADWTIGKCGEPHSLPPLVTPVFLFSEEIVNGANFLQKCDLAHILIIGRRSILSRSIAASAA
jgi:hypothetical protein